MTQHLLTITPDALEADGTAARKSASRNHSSMTVALALAAAEWLRLARLEATE